MKKPTNLAKELNKTDQQYRDHANGKSTDRDRSWADWCAKYLLSQTLFQSLTKRLWTESDLSQALQDLEASYRHTSQRHHWSVYFGQRLSE